MTTIFPTARDQAKAQTESIAAMVARLEHARTCTGADSDDCDLFGSVVLEALGYELGTERLYDALGNPDIPEQRAEYHDADAAVKVIRDHPLRVEVRSGWETPRIILSLPGASRPGRLTLSRALTVAEYSILLCTGHDAAVRVQGNLSLGQPVTAYAEHLGWSVRDGWDTTWTRYDPPHPADWTPGRRTPFEAFVQPALLAYAAEILA